MALALVLRSSLDLTRGVRRSTWARIGVFGVREGPGLGEGNLSAGTEAGHFVLSILACPRVGVTVDCDLSVLVPPDFDD